jgi:hypothetical protein
MEGEGGTWCHASVEDLLPRLIDKVITVAILAMGIAAVFFINGPLSPQDMGVPAFESREQDRPLLA